MLVLLLALCDSVLQLEADAGRLFLRVFSEHPHMVYTISCDVQITAPAQGLTADSGTCSVTERTQCQTVPLLRKNKLV